MPYCSTDGALAAQQASRAGGGEPRDALEAELEAERLRQTLTQRRWRNVAQLRDQVERAAASRPADVAALRSSSDRCAPDVVGSGGVTRRTMRPR